MEDEASGRRCLSIYVLHIESCEKERLVLYDKKVRHERELDFISNVS